MSQADDPDLIWTMSPPPEKQMRDILAMRDLMGKEHGNGGYNQCTDSCIVMKDMFIVNTDKAEQSMTESWVEEMTIYGMTFY